MIYWNNGVKIDQKKAKKNLTSFLKTGLSKFISFYFDFLSLNLAGYRTKYAVFLDKLIVPLEISRRCRKISVY